MLSEHCSAESLCLENGRGQAACGHKSYMNTVVALKGTFNATFPRLSWLPKGGDRVAGRELGELITSGLRERGFNAEDVSYQEPFFVTRCWSGDYQYKILSYLYYPDEVEPIWAVECVPKLGFLAKLLGKSEEVELAALLGAIHDTLLVDARVRDQRWFKKALPASPFSVSEYALSPV